MFTKKQQKAIDQGCMKIITVSHEELHGILNNELELTNLPANSFIHSVFYRPETLCIHILLCCPNFKQTPRGEMFPTLYGNFLILKKKKG